MKILFFLLLVQCIVFQSSYAQEFSKSWGKISQKEMDMVSYEKDPDAEALILYDLGESEFIVTDHGLDIQFTRTKRIKILKQSGIEYADIKLPYYVDGYGKTERYSTIEAVSYNMDAGRLVKTQLDEGTIYEEIINDLWKAKKFVIPNVKEGTIIEYKSVLVTPFHFNLPDWNFQDVIPTLYSEYVVKLVPFYDYVFIAQGISKFSYQHSEPENGLNRRFAGIDYRCMVSKYVLKDVPAFKDEAYMTSPQDYLIKMDFQLAKINDPRGASREVITTWEKLNTLLIKHTNFGKYINKSKKYAEQTIEKELNLADLDDMQKAVEIIDYVKKAYSWNGYDSKYSSKTPKEFSVQKNGNAADINLFLIALLESAGFSVQPIILSTRSHGKIKSDYPFSHYFNYVIPKVQVGDRIFLTDGTDPNIAYNRIPPRLINEKGLIVDEEEVKWVDLQLDIKSTNHYTIALGIDPESAIAQTTIYHQSTEFEALQNKHDYDNDTTKIRNHLLENGFEQLHRITTRGFNNPMLPYTIGHEGAIKIEQIDGKLIVPPFLKFPIQENKLTQKTRSFPVDFIYPKAESFKSTITIPENYKVASIPHSFDMENGLADIKLVYRMQDDEVIVEGEYYFKKSTYQPNEYARIKSYLNAIVQKFNAPIILQQSVETLSE